jgi:transcriptional regulator with XRE-family HTH domain
MPTSSNPKSEKAPTVELGKYLRRLREAAGFATQGALSGRLNVSHDYISKCEGDKLVPAKDILGAWLETCRASEEATEYITALWHVACKLRGGIPQFFEKYAKAEEKATLLRLWGLLLIPGPLQTPEYARAIFLAVGLDEDEAAEKVDVRVKRRARVDGPNAAQVIALIYEPALDNQVGTIETMVGQLEDLLELPTGAT